MKNLLLTLTAVAGLASPARADSDRWFVAVPGDLSQMSDYRCEEETTGPAEFIRLQRYLHPVEVYNTMQWFTGKVVETSLYIAGSAKPFVMYRGIDRCEAALPSLEAKHVAQQKDDAKYQ